MRMCSQAKYTMMVTERRSHKHWDRKGCWKRSSESKDRMVGIDRRKCAVTQVMHGWVHLVVKQRQTTFASRMAPPATASRFFRSDPSCRTSTGTPPCFIPVWSWPCHIHAAGTNTCHATGDRSCAHKDITADMGIAPRSMPALESHSKDLAPAVLVSADQGPSPRERPCTTFPP